MKFYGPLLVLPIVILSIIGCSKQQKGSVLPPVTATGNDSILQTTGKVYPYTDTFQGELSVVFANSYPSDGGNYAHTDPHFYFYVIHPKKDSVIFYASYPIGLEATGEYSAINIYSAGLADSPGVYHTAMHFLNPANFNATGGAIKYLLDGESLAVSWSCILPVLSICADVGTSTGNYTGVLTNKHSVR